MSDQTTYTPAQLHYLKHTLGVVPVSGNPYTSPTSRRDYFERQDYEAHEQYEEQRRSDAIRFDDLYSEREMHLWADCQHYKTRSEHLEATIREACKVLQTNSLVEAVRKVVADLREAKSPKPIAEQADKE